MKSINILPFIHFLRKSGLHISIDEAILSQKIIDSARFITASSMRQALKAILVRSRTDFEVFDSCFDIFFLKSIKDSYNPDTDFTHESLSITENNHIEEDKNSSQAGATPQNMSEQVSGESGQSPFALDLNDSMKEPEIFQAYMRWLPRSLKEYATSFLYNREKLWQDAVDSFVALIFGHGQYKYEQTIAERYNRSSQQFTTAYSQLLSEIKQNESMDQQIQILEQVELLKKKIETFLRQVRLALLSSNQIDSSLLLRQLYSSIYLPNLKQFFDEEFNRIEGDIEKVRQYLLSLGKKIAIQERRKRQTAQKGKINFRKTIRKNISIGGTLVHISFHKKKRQDPKIVFLADVSGSTEWVSEFFFVITYAAQTVFKKLALFEFDSTCVEITQGLKSPTLSRALLKRIQSWENPPRVRSGHSNYQTSLEDFLKIGERFLSKDTNVLILGDCRDWLGAYRKENNEFVPESKFLLEKLSRLVKRIIILNPEPPESWNTGDSIVSHFENAGARIHYVANILTLIDFIFKKQWYA